MNRYRCPHQFISVAIATVTVCARLELFVAGVVAHGPIGRMLDAFQTHPVFALGERHGNKQGHRFRLSLILDPRFPELVSPFVRNSD